MKILVLGSTGMLGNAMLRFLSEDSDLYVIGASRNSSNALSSITSKKFKLVSGINVENYDVLVKLISEERPQLVINCIGLVKQLSDSDDPLQAIPINSLLPHRIAALCRLIDAKLIHFSTDCVFTGDKGGYTELSPPNPTDLYGKSKLLGEVDCYNAITLRTSIIGHELAGSRSLVNWFLSQSEPVNGFRRAIYTGLPTVEIARVVRDFILPRLDSMFGIYHVASDPINKFELLSLIAKTYSKNIIINPTDDFAIDRSLDASRFNNIVGYRPPSWPELVNRMFNFK
jgi:dTDP-4-dehydrorhamnose reductase